MAHLIIIIQLLLDNYMLYITTVGRTITTYLQNLFHDRIKQTIQ